MMRSLTLTLMGCAVLVLTGCASSTDEQLKAHAIASCPKQSTQDIVATRQFLDGLIPGQTPTKTLRRGPAPIKSMYLIRAYEPALMVYFYKTSLQGCSWLTDESAHVPVIAETTSPGMVMGIGRDTLQTLQAQGWQLAYRQGWLHTGYAAIPWPWQTWDYTYLPRQ